MLAVTIDTNVFCEYIAKQDKWKEAEQVFALAEQGKIRPAATTRVWADIPNGPLRKKFESLFAKPWFRLSRAATKLDSDTGEETDYASDFMIDDFMDALKKRDRKNGRRKKIPSQNDRDHVQGHYLSRRDVFLTWDQQVLRWAEELKPRFGILAMMPEEFLKQFRKEGEGMLRWIRELQIEGKVLDECQIIVAGRALGLGDREITLRYMLHTLESLLPKADRETIAEVLENMADRGILIRLEGDEPTYALALSNAEWEKRWVVGSVEFDRKWELLWRVTSYALVIDGYDNEEARELRKLHESARRNLEIMISELPRDSNSPSP